MTTPPPPFTAAAVQQICQVLAEAVTGSEIPNLIVPLNAPEEPGEEINTKWKRLFNAAVAAQNRQHDGRPLVRLILAVMNPVRFQSQVDFDDRRIKVNEKLLFSGLQVREDGKVVRVAQAATTVAEVQQRADDLRAELTRRDVHPDVLRFCRVELLQQNYFHAVLEASKSVADKLRTKTAKKVTAHPWSMRRACPNPGPRIAFNSLATEWELSEQTGIAMLMKGLFSTFRNPTAHAPKVLWASSRSQALDMLTLASMLRRRLGATIR